MTVSIVGTGRVARALGRRLRELGWSVGAVTGRSLASARAAVHAIGGGQAFGMPTPKILNSKLILIATPDGAIATVAKNLSAMGGSSWRGKIVLHTSGALDATVLKPLADQGASTGSMHPIQTFSDQNAPDLSQILFGIDGCSRRRADGQKNNSPDGWSRRTLVWTKQGGVSCGWDIRLWFCSGAHGNRNTLADVPGFQAPSGAPCSFAASAADVG